MQITQQSQDELEREFKHELSKLGAALNQNPAVTHTDMVLINILNKKFIEFCDGARLLRENNTKENVTI